ncbi:MAG: hypothetical protein A2Y38_16555 [Spirochaetes bacterium GWB1_59_5]|nr:MAG: hypothetical protein A2Y38_16555 [Spirochaetes bacterium GWB1_59_5]
MTTYAVNAETGASTRYADYGFDSFCKGPDGKYYGIKADGLYLLEGTADAVIDFGDLDFGTSAHKALAAAYVSGSSAAPLVMTITQGGDSYEYPAKTCSDTIDTHRFDTAKGLKSNYFGVKIGNQDGGDFTIDAAELVPVQLSRRI